MLFSLFERGSLKIKYSIIKISYEMILFVVCTEHSNAFNSCREMINSVILVSGRTAVDMLGRKLSEAIIVYCCSKIILLIRSESSVFSGLTPNRFTNNLFVLRSSFLINVYILYILCQGWNYRRFYQVLKGKSKVWEM